MPNKKAEEIEKEKELLYKDLKSTITTNIEFLISNKLKDKDENGKLYSRNKIAQDLNISCQALLNYTTDRIPEYKQLAYIKKYFKIPYSLLFQSKQDNESISNNKDVDNTILLGLDSETTEILKSLAINSRDDNWDNNYINKTKLFLINSIIKNDKLITDMADYFSMSLGRNQLDKKYNEFHIYTPFKNDDAAYGMIKYAITYNFIGYLESIVKGDNVPKDIKKYAEDYALKYAGKRQEIIRKCINKN